MNSVLKYAEFYNEQLLVKGLKKSQCPEFIKMQTGLIVSVAQVYEYLEGKHCPNAAMASTWEQAFGVNLPASYYGAGVPTKPGRAVK